jgi:MATE family multidrug resistance protein
MTAVPGSTAPLTHRQIFAIAVPIMIANVTTPMLGVVDTAVMGRTPDPAYIGAVALGALIFNFLFWGFGFLRMGTTGLTAQAFGSGDIDEVRASLGRAVLVALGVGAGLILLQWPIGSIAFAVIDGPARVEALARTYYDVRIWAAPATLVNYALLGWFIGLGRARAALALQLVLNLLNMAINVLLVLGLHLGVAGVALGTVLAEVSAALIGCLLAARTLRRMGGRWSLPRLFDGQRLRRTLAVNADIMIRSLALIVMFAWFMTQGARQGEGILAANAVLMQFIAVSAFFLDGLAFAAEALVGRAAGAGDRNGVAQAARMTTAWAGAIALVLCLVFAAGGALIVDLLSVDPGVRLLSRHYLPWAVLAPLAGVWCFQLDGIFIGATRTAAMRNAMLMSMAIFFVAWWLLSGYANHGLWASFYVHYAARAGTLLAFLPGLLRAVTERPG